MKDDGRRCVAIVIPVLNEERHLEQVVRSLACQEVDRVAEILIVDGGSSDGSLTVARRLSHADARVRVLQNPKRLQSAAMNLAASRAAAEVTTLIRADAHAEYPANFIARLLDEREKSGADSVVNRLVSRGMGCFQRAVAAVSNSAFGTGGAVHRSGGESGFVDHGHHALFDRQRFESLGGYDETFVANEDAEYDVRLRAAGGKIWFTAYADIVYFPRDAVKGLARQYYRYGLGRAGTRNKHGEALRLRQTIPPTLALGLALSLGLSFVSPWLLMVWALYLGGVCAATALLVIRTRDACVTGAVLALPIIHICWGCGFIVGVVTGAHRLRRTSDPGAIKGS